MANYYQILEIASDATPALVEVALDTKYNQWRQLVTHHDPQVVNQANQALQSLEKIRATLTDPAQRSAYDAGIGLGGVVEGLADPDAVLRAAAPQVVLTPPVKATADAAQSAAGQRQDIWVCPNGKCSTANPIGTLYCQACGSDVGRECPNCHVRIYIKAAFCPECRADIKKFLDQKQREEAEQNRLRAERQIRIETLEIEIVKSKESLDVASANKPKYPASKMGFSIAVSAVVTIMTIWAGIVIFEGYGYLTIPLAFFGLPFALVLIESNLTKPIKLYEAQYIKPIRERIKQLEAERNQLLSINQE